MNPSIESLLDFTAASPTAYQAADFIAKQLKSAGFMQLQENQAWKLEAGKSYFVLRSSSALIAFKVGAKPPRETGFSVAGAHTDSPALKARIDKSLSGKGLERVAVEVYGGPIISTWLDRPLNLAGRAVLRTRDGAFENRLFNLGRPVGVIPNLAIHLNRDINKGFEYNAQTQLPVLVSALPLAAGSAAEGSAWPLRLVAEELEVQPQDLLAADLFFADAQKPALLGPEDELINAPRLDDLVGCHAILKAFLEADVRDCCQVAAFLDNEEIGSRTAQGADSAFLRDILARLSLALGEAPSDLYQALAKSFCISIDVAQAFHPSYGEKFDESFAPLLNGGPAIKSNANYRYATDAESEARFRLICEKAGVPCQKFQSRADMNPGSTIGTMNSALTGIATVDIGAALLSMHSIRETCGARDHEMMIAALTAFYGQG